MARANEGDTIGLSQNEYKRIALGYFEKYGLEINEGWVSAYCRECNCESTETYILKLLEQYKPRFERKYLTIDGFLDEASKAQDFGFLEELYEDFCYFTAEEKIIKGFIKSLYKVGVPSVIQHIVPVITTIENDEIFTFNGEGIWESGEYRINELLEKQNMKHDTKIKFTIAQKTEVIKQLKHRSYKPITYFDNAPPYIIPLKNGVLDLRTMELRDFRIDDYFTKKLSVEYEPKATAERFEKFVEEISIGEGNTDTEKEKDRNDKIITLKQLIGYCLWRDYPIQKLFFLIGGGANGKGVYLTILQKLFGIENVSSVSIKNLSEDKFAGAELHSNYVNLSSELTGGKLQNMDFVKSLTGGDLITAQKKFQHPFKFVNYGKLLIASNHPPEVADASIGFFRRVNMISFMRTFLGKDADKSLIGKLTTKESLSGILNIGLKHLKEWVDEDGKFDETAEFRGTRPVDETQMKYERLADPINAFIFDCVNPSPDDDAYLTRDAVYLFYVDYCVNRNLPRSSQVLFSREFKLKARFVSDTKRTTDNQQRKQCWYGLTVDEDSIKPQKEIKTTQHGL